MQLKFKRLHADAVIPQYAKAGDAGLDLVATEIIFNDTDDFGNINVKFGLAVEIPENHVGLLFPRSSIYKNNTLLCNSVGVIDSGYRGELQAFMLGDIETFGYKKGDKVLQLVIMPIPALEVIEVEELSNTERGKTGFGSSGK